jgi:hypothetical protein
MRIWNSADIALPGPFIKKTLILQKPLDVIYLDVLFDLGLPLGIHLDLWGDEGGHRHKLQVGVANQLPACRYENIRHRTTFKKETQKLI